MRHHRWDLPADLGAVPKVRELVCDTLTSWGARPESVDDAVLIFDELCANAFRHGSAPVSVLLYFTGEEISGEIIDTGEFFVPRRRQVGLSEESGRGLQIVETLATTWGVRPLQVGGKSVWFRLVHSHDGHVAHTPMICGLST
ncbi:ATP-binding protein [Sphaerisporangium album]|uniref:ATP-binding protein n=1 Tax=Sphaerisporangium album TaxID=509200 RepID=A0A367FQA4_9ACTN|nr:ATP-binding protein [Sphaerisporangium album]RCG32022.1 ATP-binding protein [Sphaerisporangium album]